ncbi:MAG TPA: hypothetical protein VK616_06180 [Flavitalea sp.]|nr:hypothetical protein [Flavitalea sp.]
MRENVFRYADLIICIPFLLAPFFINLPYRVNIFLSWEGAYRLSIGQIPYKDFGLPMGIGYWLIPAAFFKIFGSAFLSLIKSQFLINLMSILALRGILCNLKLKPVIVALAVLVFCLTYVIYNFWPWYNHSVIVFELIAIYFLTRTFSVERQWVKYGLLCGSAFFTVFTFFTKQDVGAICFMICIFLLVYETILSGDKKILAAYGIFIAIFSLAATLPFIKYDFLYWFNYGQFPHNPRINIHLLLSSVLEGSRVEKLYLIGILILVFLNQSFRQFLANKNLFILSVVCAAMIVQAIVTRVTSPLPTDHMSYYHVFGFVVLISFLPWDRWSNEILPAGIMIVFIMILYSEGYWRYAAGMFQEKTTATIDQEKNTGEKWTLSRYEVLKRIYLPASTIQGIDSLMGIPILKKKDLKVLNMSELTFLAKELNYVPLTDHPLWFHVNIGMFQKEIDEINQKVKDRYYDVVLFEDIPSLTEFYPYQVRDQLELYYKSHGKFLAPRKLEDSSIEVFINESVNEEYALGDFQHSGPK